MIELNINRRKKFSEIQKLNRDLSVLLSGDKPEEMLRQWASNIVEALDEFEQKKYFEVEINIVPSPKNCKGMDNVKITVYETDSDATFVTGSVRKVKFNAGHCVTINDCVTAINQQIDAYQETRRPAEDIVEMNGKRYKLVEIE